MKKYIVIGSFILALILYIIMQVYNYNFHNERYMKAHCIFQGKVRNTEKCQNYFYPAPTEKELEEQIKLFNERMKKLEQEF